MHSCDRMLQAPCDEKGEDDQCALHRVYVAPAGCVGLQLIMQELAHILRAGPVEPVAVNIGCIIQVYSWYPGRLVLWVLLPASFSHGVQVGA